jgi:hypothetical protein
MIVASEKAPLKRKDTQGTWVDCKPETFLVSSVSGMLHVLAGERPVPSIRKNILPGSPQRVSRLDELAKETLVEVLSGIEKDTKTGGINYFPKWGETLMVRKSSTLKNDSVYPSSYPLSLSDPCPNTRRLLTWDRFKAHVSNKVYTDLVALFQMSDPSVSRSTPFITSLKKIRSNLSPELVLYTSENVKEPWKSLILKGKCSDASPLRTGYNGIESMTFRMSVSRGKETVSIRDAILYVPVTDEDILLFSKGPGCATILEGGVATLGYLGGEEHLRPVEEITNTLAVNAVKTFSPEEVVCI